MTAWLPTATADTVHATKGSTHFQDTITGRRHTAHTQQGAAGSTYLSDHICPIRRTLMVAHLMACFLCRCAAALCTITRPAFQESWPLTSIDNNRLEG